MTFNFLGTPMPEVVLIGAALAGFGIWFIFSGVTMPRRSKRAVTLGERDQIDVFGNVPGQKLLTKTAIEAGQSLDDLANDKTRRDVERKLKAAGWWWAPGETNKPVPDAPFWDLHTYWGSKAGYMMLYGGFGALFGLVMVAQFGLPLLIAAGAVALGAVVGYMEPDGKLAKAARKRQELITLEMGFKVPELSTYAMSSGVETSLRQLGNRPGGPFVAETRRVIRIYDARGSLAPGLDQMRDRNPGEQIQEFATQLRMAAEQGGNLLAALDVLSASSRRAMSRYIRERTLRNLRAVRGQIVVWMGVLVLLLMLAPIAITVAGSLGSM